MIAPTDEIRNVKFFFLYPKKSVLRQFSALSRLTTMDFFVIKIIDKVISLSKFWRHLAKSKLSKLDIQIAISAV